MRNNYLKKCIIFLVVGPIAFTACLHGRQPKNIYDVKHEIPTVPHLGAGDVIEVRIFGEEELSGKYQIPTTGQIRMPLIGSVKIAGGTAEAAGKKIAKLYEGNYLKNADVSVQVLEFKSRKVFVLGEVNSPGPFGFEENMTLIEAIARAGGTNELSSPNRTIVTRDQNGKKTRFIAKLADIGRGESADFKLLPGDIIFVPESIF